MFKSRSVFDNPIYDWLFIIFPIWIGLIYFFLISLFPQDRILIFFFFLFIFGESHFGITWLFFSKKDNIAWVINRKKSLIYVPLFLISIFIFIGLINLQIAILILTIISIFHITRQSVGIYKLYSNKYVNFEIIHIYFSTLVWSFVGFVRFFIFPYLETHDNHLVESLYPVIFYFSLITIIIYLILVFKNYISSQNLYSSATFATGLLLFSPIAFVEYPQDATVIGVGMHWCQYLALNSKLYFSNLKKRFFQKPFFTNPFILLVLVISYSAIMSLLITDYAQNFSNKSHWILIALSMEIYHFYLDAFIWRFSDPYIREKIGKKLFSNKI